MSESGDKGKTPDETEFVVDFLSEGSSQSEEESKASLGPVVLEGASDERVQERRKQMRAQHRKSVDATAPGDGRCGRKGGSGSRQVETVLNRGCCGNLAHWRRTSSVRVMCSLAGRSSLSVLPRTASIHRDSTQLGTRVLAAGRCQTAHRYVTCVCRDTTTNPAEGANAANMPARKLPMHRAVLEFNDMMRERYMSNRAEAHEEEGRLPPKVQEKLDEVVESASQLEGDVHFPDDNNRLQEAKVPGHSTSVYTSNIDKQGDGDVLCSCGLPPVRGHPCAHNIKHAQKMQQALHSLFHYKDTTSCWKDQYPEGQEWPSITMEECMANDFVDPKVRYPPLPPPKVGRPKNTKRKRSWDEGGPAKKKQKGLGKR